ncbi:STAS domain-containing protein [Streptomyces galilaeus]|uniref:STAS domain-containing protein n=1 Tax=Streptomyces galilaeus TaxID=33899 RepID=UPI0038F64A21
MDSIRARQPGEQLRVCSTSVAGRTVVAVTGEVDHQTATRLDDVLLTVIASGARCVEVDFSRVSFCDCAGLNVLLGARSRCLDAGVRFVVAGPVAPAVERLLQLTGTAPLLLLAKTA